MATIIPFGKYKGRTVDEIVVSDPQYFTWLAGQAWAVEKFQWLIDEARGLGGPVQSHDDDSPEHNLIQARFLDPTFCVAVLVALKAVNVAIVQAAYADEIRASLINCCDQHFKDFRRKMFKDSSNYYGDPPKDSKDLDAYLNWMVKPQPLYRYTAAIKANFEGACDVKTSFEIKRPDNRSRYVHTLMAFDALIEVKPAVGDNFPAYIRQIKGQRIRARSYGSSDLPTVALLYDKFTATNLSEAQVRAMFEQSGIPTVKLSEVEQRLDEAKRVIDTANGRV